MDFIFIFIYTIENINFSIICLIINNFKFVHYTTVTNYWIKISGLKVVNWIKFTGLKSKFTG